MVKVLYLQNLYNLADEQVEIGSYGMNCRDSSAEEKFHIVMESFTDNVTQAEICRKHGIYPVQLSKWREQFTQGGKAALAQRKNSDSRDEEIQDLKKIIGDQSFVIDAFKKRSREQDVGS